MHEHRNAHTAISFRSSPFEIQVGDFKDNNGVDCRLESSVCSSTGAVWLGPNTSRDEEILAPFAMHISPDQFNQIGVLIDRFGTLGELPTEPVVFRDFYDVPCALSASDSGELLLGIILPKAKDGSSFECHARFKYSGSLQTPDRQEAVEQMFFELLNGAGEMIDIDNRIQLDQYTALAVFNGMRQLIADGVIRASALGA